MEYGNLHDERSSPASHLYSADRQLVADATAMLILCVRCRSVGKAWGSGLQCSQLQPLDFLYRLPGNALQITVHVRRRLHDPINLRFPFGPLIGNGFLSLSRSSCIDDGLDAMAEARPGEILINHLRLGLPAFGGLSSRGDFDHGMAETIGEGSKVFGWVIQTLSTRPNVSSSFDRH